MNNHPNRGRTNHQVTDFILTDAHGRSYFEGQTFTREAALAAVKQITEFPYGIYLCPTEADTGVADVALISEEIADAYYNHVKVAAGTGEDRDTGYIHMIEGDAALVGWDSGVSTMTALADLTITA